MQDQIHPKKDILGTKPKKTIVKFEISSFEYHFVRIFILNKTFSDFGTKFVQKKYFRGKISENNCRIQNQQPWIPLCTWCYFKQSTFKFRDQIPLPPQKNLGSYFRKIKGHSTLFWETAKRFSQFWLIVGYNVNILGHCGSFWVIVAHSGLARFSIAFW